MKWFARMNPSNRVLVIAAVLFAVAIALFLAVPALGRDSTLGQLARMLAPVASGLFIAAIVMSMGIRVDRHEARMRYARRWMVGYTSLSLFFAWNDWQTGEEIYTSIAVIVVYLVVIVIMPQLFEYLDPQTKEEAKP